MNKRPPLLAFALALAPLLAHAQMSPAPTPARPQAPFVAAPRPGSTWQITVQFEGGNAPAAASPAPRPRLPVSIVSHCGTGVIYTVVTWSDGTRSDGYVQGDRYVQKQPVGGKIYSLPVEDQNFLLPIFTKGYQGTAWIDAASFQQVETSGKKEAFQYAKQVADRSADLEPGATEARQIKLAGWIDTADKVPTRMVLGNMTYLFGPVTEAPADLPLPADIKEYLERANKEQTALSLMRQAAHPPRR